MAYPTFGAAGALTTSGSTTNTPALPAGISVGDLLISITTTQNNQAFTGISAGWTVGPGHALGDLTGVHWAFRIATGSDTACTWTSASTDSSRAGQCYRFSGCSAAPFRNATILFGGQNTAMAIAGRPGVSANSLALNIGIPENTTRNTTVSTPAGYTSLYQQNTTQTFALFGANIANVGDSIPSVASTAGTSTWWCELLIELASVGDPDIPTLATIGAVTTTTGTTNAPALPTGVVAGDLLIAMLMLAANKTLTSISAGWTLGAPQALSDNDSVKWAWRVATGSDSACTFTLGSSSTTNVGRCFRFVGAHPITPIGTSTRQYSASSTTAMGINGFNTGANLSVGLNLVIPTSVRTTAFTFPPGYNMAAYDNNAGNQNMGLFMVAMGLSGSAIPTSSSTAGTATWSSEYLIELLSAQIETGSIHTTLAGISQALAGNAGAPPLGPQSYASMWGV